jgi:isocitrate/isopropylmalate dehydrogenase
MPAFQIAVIAGDGVGVEVIPPAKRVLEQISRRHQLEFRYQDFDWGSGHYFQHGRMMPADAIDRLRPYDAILLGAPEAARQIEQAVAGVLAAGHVRTPDLGGRSSTEEVTDAVLQQLA